MHEYSERSRLGSRIKIALGLLAAVFTMTLAVVVGNRLSDQALAVLAGAVCGVAAAIPTSLLIVAVTRRRDESRVAPTAPTYGNYPPVVVVTGPGPQQQASGWNALPASMVTAPTERRFTVVGSPGVEQEVSHVERYA